MSGLFERFSHSVGDPLPWEHAIVSLDTQAHELTVWRIPSAADGDARYDILAGGRYASARYALSGNQQRGALHDRATGETVSWATTDANLRTSNADYVVFERANPDMRATGVLEVLHAADLVPAFTALVEPSNFQADVRFSPDGRWLAAWSSPRDADGRLQFVDLASGAVSVAAEAPAVLDGFQLSGPRMRVEPGGVALEVRYYEPVVAREYGPERPVLRGFVSWGQSGATLDRSTILLTDREPLVARSPGGLTATEVMLRVTGDAGGLEGGERWPALDFTGPAGVPSLRVRSASLGYGDNVPERQWLADDSGLVALVASGYAIIGADGSVTPFPPVPMKSADSPWWERTLTAAPMPSPDNPDLFSVGRTALYDGARDQWVPLKAGGTGPSHVDPWVAGSGEMILALGHGGHDGWGPPQMLGPAVELPPYPGEPGIVLTAGPEGCVTVRTAPGHDAPELACLPDGARATFVPGDADALTGSNGESWINLRTDAGDGWAPVALARWDG